MRLRVMKGRTDEESSNELEAVTGYQLCLDSEPDELRSGDCADREAEREAVFTQHSRGKDACLTHGSFG